MPDYIQATTTLPDGRAAFVIGSTPPYPDAQPLAPAADAEAEPEPEAS